MMFLLVRTLGNLLEIAIFIHAKSRGFRWFLIWKDDHFSSAIHELREHLIVFFELQTIKENSQVLIQITHRAQKMTALQQQQTTTAPTCRRDKNHNLHQNAQ